MKNGSLFWGTLLMTLGILFFLERYDIFYINADLFTDFWPLLLIFIGLIVIVKEKVFRPIITGIFGLFAALLVFSFFNNASCSSDCDTDYDNYNTNTYSEKYYDGTEEALLEVSSGAGTFEILGTTDNLVYARSKGNAGNYNFTASQIDNKAKVDIDFPEKNFKFWHKNYKNDLQIKLNETPVWRLELNIGAAKSKFDLSEFKIEKLYLHTGATDTRIKLGDKQSKCFIETNMGAADLRIDIPQSSGIKLTGQNFLITKDLPDDMYKDEEGNYISQNFNDAENQVKLVINGAAANIKIRRY